MMTAWGMAGYCLPLLIQRRLDLPGSTGSFPAAVAVSKTQSEKCFDYPNRTYLAEPLNGTLVLLQSAGVEPAVDYGELAVGSEFDFPGGRRNCGAAVAAGT